VSFAGSLAAVNYRSGSPVVGIPRWVIAYGELWPLIARRLLERVTYSKERGARLVTYRRLRSSALAVGVVGVAVIQAAGSSLAFLLASGLPRSDF